MKENIPMHTPLPQTPEEIINPPHKAGFRQLFAILRFSLFIAALTALTLFVLPEEFIPSSLSMRIIGGALAGAIILTIIFYFLIPRHTVNDVGTALNFEATSAIIIGVLTLIFLSIITLLKGVAPTNLFLGVIPLAIYLYYIYRIVKDTLRLTIENEKMRRQYGELLEIDREKSDFINITSHQLRTPLTEIRWSLEQVLTEKTLESPARITIEKSLGSVKRLIGIVEEMFKAKTIDGVNADNHRASADLATLMREIINELQSLSREKGVALDYTAANEAITIEANREELKAALFNIIDNAIRYSPKGNIHVVLNTEENDAQIRVEDTGIGIDMADYGRVFQKFFRGKNAMLLQPDGSGVGLHATKRVVEKHGGTINFFSVLGKGTIFIIRLPKK